jgi:dTDP-4-dehydrorhamnose 3,5-epimerase
MEVVSLPIDGALQIALKEFRDDRGWFKESYAATRYRNAGIVDTFVQDNLSMSGRFVLRGLHGDARMAKLVQVLGGLAYDVIVDLRAASPTFMQWYGVMLSADQPTQIYIPAGCLHGFLALENGTLLSYKQTAEYDAATEFGVAWDDPDLSIAWPLEGARPVLSAKDAANPTLRERGIL